MIKDNQMSTDAANMFHTYKCMFLFKYVFIYVCYVGIYECMYSVMYICMYACFISMNHQLNPICNHSHILFIFCHMIQIIICC